MLGAVAQICNPNSEDTKARRTAMNSRSGCTT